MKAQRHHLRISHQTHRVGVSQSDNARIPLPLQLPPSKLIIHSILHKRRVWVLFYIFSWMIINITLFFLHLTRSSPSTAITWSALGCSSNPSHNVSAHTSAAAAAAKAASNTGRRPYISTKPKSPRISTQVTNRRRIYKMNKTLAI